MTNFWEQFEDAAPSQNNNKPVDFWEQFDRKQAPAEPFGKWGVTELKAAPKKNLLTDFRDCLNWVNRATLSAWQEGKEQTETANLEIKDMLGKITDRQKERLNVLNNKPETDYHINEKKYLVENETNLIPRMGVGLQKGYIEAVKMLPYMWETIKAGGVGSGVGAAGGAAIGTGIGLATTKANTPQLALQGARVGGTWGGRITGAMKIAELEGGLARNELKQINEEIKEKGGEPLSKAEIDALALSVGAVNAGLEMVSLKQLLKTVPGGDKILANLEKKNLRELAMDKTVREQLRGVFAQYSKSIATEMTTEMLQETTNIVADEMARKLGGVDNTPLEQNVARVIDTGKATFGATLFLGGAGSAAKATTILAKQGMTRPEAEQAVKNMTPQEIDEVVENNLDTLFKSIEDIPSVKKTEETQKLSEQYYNQIMQAHNENVDEELARAQGEAQAKIFANLASLIDEDDVNTIAKEANIVYQSLSDEQAQQQYEADNSAALNGRVVFNDSQVIDDELQRLYDDFDTIPEDYDNKDDLNNRIMQMQILQDVKDGTLSEENQQAAQDLIAQYEQTNPQLATALRDAMSNKSNNLDDGIQEVEFQKIDTAGAENNQTALARQEWKNKGTESRFFKKFTNNAPLVTPEKSKAYKFKTGKKVAVQGYHGTQTQQLKGDKFNNNNNEYFFSNDNNAALNYGDNIYDVYISFKNPFVVDLKGENDIQIYDYIDEAKEQGHDGVIALNTYDGASTHHQYVAFNNTQIKSVNNQGTFDENNPNIYFQKTNILQTIRDYLSKPKNVKNIKTIDDILDIFPPFNRIADFFEDIKDVKMMVITDDKNPSRNGYYDPRKDVFYLNASSNAYVGQPTSRINTILHELQHAKQKRLYDKYSKELKENKNLSPEERQLRETYIANYKATGEANKKHQNFKKKYRKDLVKAELLRRIGDLDKPENAKYKDLALKRKILYDNYYNSTGEVDARQTAYSLLDRIGLKEQYEYERNDRHNTTRLGNSARVQRGWNDRARGLGLYQLAQGYEQQGISGLSQENERISPLFQSAYHGTPHRFDKFSTEHIGSGEGNQAHGWGLYFAGNKEVSEDYRKTLSDTNGIGTEIKVDDKTYKKVATNTYRNKNDLSESVDDYLNKALNFIETKGSKKEALKYIQNQIDNNKNAGYFDEAVYYIRIKDSLNEIKQAKITKYADDYGQLFEVDIPDNDVLLDEDEPFSTQTENVKNSIKALIKDLLGIKSFTDKDLDEEIKKTEKEKEENYNYIASRKLQLLKDLRFDDTVGKDFYNHLAEYLRVSEYITNPQHKKEASLVLNKYGIKGITYDGQQDGRCYVIFDDKAISTLKTYYQGIDDMNSNINNARGFTYQRKNFDGTEKENLIVLLNKKVDKSTLMHEFAHVYLITLNRLALHNDKAKELLMRVNKWLHYDGSGEYTEFQHERFANHFVAYVATGKAPNYGLKKVFENFRRWLNNLYTDLQNDENIWIDPEAEELFEKLLGNITINAQKQEAEQIINKARNNSIRRYSDDTEKLKRKFEKKQLTEYQKRYRDTALSIVYYALKNSRIPEAAKYTNYNQLQMILLATPEYKRKSKGVAKQQEEIGDILAELDDAFFANDGFLGDWSEFFTDTGVGYDTQDVGGDAELATKAFEVLVRGKYADATPDYYGDGYGDLSEEEQVRTGYELEYIIDEYRNADDKTIPLLAYNEWSKRVHPYIEEDIQKEWERQTNEIDRYQALSKFEQAKEDLKLYAAALKGRGDYSAQFAEYARAIVKRLDFMTETDKSKLFDKLKEFNSFRDIERNLDDVMDYAQTLADVSDRRHLSEQIDKEVRQTIHVWQNGIKKTKYTYPANKLFERLREINKMSSSAIQDMYDAYLNKEDTPDYSDDSVHDKNYYSLIEEQFIKYKINGIWYNSTEFLQDLLERLQTAKYTAKIARDEIDFERRMQQLNLVDECAKAVNSRKEEIDKNPSIKTAANLNSIGANLNNYLEMIFNEGIKKQFSLDYKFAQRDAKTGAEKRAFEDKAKKIFGFSGKFSNTQLYNKFINMTVPEYKILQRYSPDIEQGSYRVTQQMPETGFNATQYTQQVRQDIDFAKEWQPEEIELSRMEILYYYIQAKNPTSYVILTDKDKGQFDKFDFDAMIDTLTPQEKLLGDLMQISAERYWNDLNAYHIKKYQVELGKVKNYFPRYTDFSEEKPYQIFNDFAQSTSSGSMQKQRIAGPGSRIKPANALAVLYDHMDTANTITIMGEQLDLMNRVLLNKDLLKKIEAVFGSTVSLQYQSALTSMLYKSQSCVKSLSEDFFSSAVNNSVKAAMFAKPTLALKQVISFMNYGKGDEYVSAGEWLKEFSKQTLTPAKWKSNIEYMMNIPYLKDRYLSGGSMDALKRQLTSMLFPNITANDKVPKVGKAMRTLTTMGAKLNLLDEYFGKYIAMGDIGAIVLGGKPYIEVLKNKGYTEEQAVRIFIETTVNDQQSSIPSTLSNAQRSASKQPFAKMFFNFQNTSWQYYRHCTSAIMRVMQNPEKKNIVKAGKMLFCYGWLFPAVFAMAGSLSPLMAAGGDPDDLINDINPIRTLSTLLTQHPLFGDMLQTILAGINGEQYNSSNVISTHLKAYNKFLRHMVKQKLTPLDVWNAVAAFGEERTGIPLTTIGSRASGLYDMTQGEIPKGLLKYAGYTDYRAKRISGE